MHEASMHAVSSFVTLTYDDAHLSASLNYSDFQRFMYRVRKRFGPTRFFMCGEYGVQNWRPHFHALLFGLTFKDGQVIGTDLYRSRELELLWPYGYSSFGGVSMQSAGYVARYSLKKVTGDAASSHYSRVDSRTGEIVQLVPEFGHMSLKPGIGFEWFKKYWKDVFAARDGVVMPGGHVMPAPRYYWKLLESIDWDRREELELERYLTAGKFAEDTTAARLAVRELCQLAKEKFRKERAL